MAFNLKKVLKALLLSSSQPLSIKDVQAAFSRFHERGSLPVVAADDAAAVTSEKGGEGQNLKISATADTADAATGDTSAAAVTEAGEVAEVFAEAPQDPELYVDVPSLVTVTQIREVMDEIAAELRANDDGLLLI